jgi:hypothetical protein
MKSITRIFRASVLAAVIISLLAACALLADNEGNGNNDGPTHFTGILRISGQQVYEGTDSNKISGIYEKYAGADCPVSIMTFKGIQIPESNGEIKGGKLSFEVPPLEGDKLADAATLKQTFFNEYEDVSIDPPDVMSTIIVIEKSGSELLNREKMYGSSSSIWLESVWFFYADKDCTITGNPGSGRRGNESLYQTGDLNLALKQGWNTVCRKQLYEGAHGIEEDSDELKNPNDFKWAIRLR